MFSLKWSFFVVFACFVVVSPGTSNQRGIETVTDTCDYIESCHLLRLLSVSMSVYVLGQVSVYVFVLHKFELPGLEHVERHFD